MKKTLILLAVIFSVSFVFAQNTPVTKANYELAARFSPKKVGKMVFSTAVNPRWFKNSDKFWYNWQMGR